MMEPPTFAPGENARLAAHLAANPRTFVLLRTSICPYGKAFHGPFHEVCAATGQHAVDALVEERDDAQWDAYHMRISPTVVLFVDGHEVARLEGRPLLGLTRGRLAKWIKTL